MAVDDSYTKSLLHFDGSDASTTFTDESGKTWTGRGNAQLDTAQFKFGTASLLLDGTGDWIDTPSSSDFDPGSGNFTIDFWWRPNSLATQVLITKRATAVFAPFSIDMVATTQLEFFCSLNGSSWGVQVVGTHGMSTGNWYHVAAVRTGDDFKLFVNGTQIGSTVTVSGALMTNSAVMSIGAVGDGTAPTNGWIDEFRFSKGIARWTSNFTPPTSAYAPLGGGAVAWFWS